MIHAALWTAHGRHPPTSLRRWRERLDQDLVEPEQRDRERESRVLARYLLRTRFQSEYCLDARWGLRIVRRRSHLHASRARGGVRRRPA